MSQDEPGPEARVVHPQFAGRMARLEALRELLADVADRANQITEANRDGAG